MLQDATARIGQRAIIAGVVALVVGCLFGWVVLGWLVFPVTWTNADPYDLRPEQKETYVVLVADSYSIDSDADLARQRVVGFSKAELGDILARLIEEREEAGDPEGKRRLQFLGVALDISPTAATPSPEETPQAGTSRFFSTVRSLVPLCGGAMVVLLVVTLIAVIVFRILKQRAARAPAPVAGGEQGMPGQRPADAPLGRFVTTYSFGDDAYDTSFNVETHGPDAEFYGACGIGFSEVLGEGSPDKIAAFEVWLFDKTDIDNVQTVTKVLMSEFAYNSEMLREKMKDRGEALLVEKDSTVVIDGVGLQLRAEILDFEYGTDPSLPTNSYFENLTAQLVPVLKS